MSITSTNDAELWLNETVVSPSVSLLLNGLTWPARLASQDAFSTFEQVPSIPSRITVSHAVSSKDLRDNAVTIEPPPAPTTTEVIRSIVSPFTLHNQPQSASLPHSPYPEYSDEEWARLSRHRHLLRKVNSEPAAYGRELYAGYKAGGFQVHGNYGLRKFRRDIPSRFAREAVTQADPANAPGTRRLPVYPARNNGHVGLSQSSQLNRWRRKVTNAQGPKHGKRKPRWAFFPTITGQSARQVKGDCYGVNTLLLNFGCWLRDESLWETVKSSPSLKPVEEWWEANRSSGGFDTATECGDEGEDEEWESMEEEEDEDELPEEDEKEEKGH